MSEYNKPKLGETVERLNKRIKELEHENTCLRQAREERVKRTVYDCDKCQAKGRADQHITIEFGWESDAAGGFGSPRQESFDLCPSCHNAVNKKMMNLLSEDARRSLLEFLVKGTQREKIWSTPKQANVYLWEL